MAKVVIVDDVLNARSMLKEFLLMMGHEVIGDFSDALKAYDFFIEKENDIDLAVLDYNLKSFKNGGEYTGVELLKDIRKINSKIKVIFLSAFAEKAIIKQAILNGASDFIVKPFNGEELNERINKVLNNAV